MNRKGPLVAATILLALASPLAAYIGPGAGFAFLSSFLVLFLTFLLALFSFLSWPFRFVWRTIRGQRAYKKGPIERLVVLGLDGMEPTLAEKFMAEGKLPNLARLKKEGAYARLRTTTPAISPVAWSSFMTGAEPSKHNIFDFLSRDPRTYLPDLSSARIGKPKRTLALGKYLLPLSKPEIRGMRKKRALLEDPGREGHRLDDPEGAHHLPAREVQGAHALGHVRPGPQGQPGNVRLLHRGRRQGPQARGRCGRSRSPGGPGHQDRALRPREFAPQEAGGDPPPPDHHHRPGGRRGLARDRGAEEILRQRKDLHPLDAGRLQARSRPEGPRRLPLPHRLARAPDSRCT